MDRKPDPDPKRQIGGELIIPVLAHRLRTRGAQGPDAREDAEAVLSELRETIPVPV